MEQNILPNTMQIQDLPAEILVRIFKHLDYYERIRLESVCPTWRTMALAYAWKDQRILRFSREMLRLDEPWKDKKRINSMIDELNRQQIESGQMGAPFSLQMAMREYWKLFTDPALYEREKPSIQLASLKAVLRRCAPFLDELHLHGAFQLRMRFGRIFFQVAHPYGRLAHLQIDDVLLDSWHLRKIQRHLAPQLLSLAVIPVQSRKSLDAFKELLANCNKLENLQLTGFMHYGQIENRGVCGQGQSSALASSSTSSCCAFSFMPSTLKFLLLRESYCCCRKFAESPEKLVNQLLSLLVHCSQLRYMPILIQVPNLQLELIQEKNPREFDKIIRLQFPFFIAKSYSFSYIQRPEFLSLKALHVDFEIGAVHIRQIAKCCPQLEHLGIILLYQNCGEYIMEIPDLVALHQFKQLSSLEILMSIVHYNNFHKMSCPDGEQADMAFLGILTELDQIHPLRSLDFKALADVRQYPSLSQDYLLQMSKKLKHLETFSCGFYVENIDIDDMTGIGQFCEQLEQIFDSQEGANKKSFKFRLLANAYEWDWGDYDQPRYVYWPKLIRRERKDLLVEWQKGSERSKMNWHFMPPTGREFTWNLHQYFEPARSIVLNELITGQFGQRTSSMLFDSFGTMETEEH